MSTLSDVGLRVGGEFKAHRLRIEDLENSVVVGGSITNGFLKLTLADETTIDVDVSSIIEDAVLSTEEIQDIVGAMFTSNQNVNVVYDDVTGRINFSNVNLAENASKLETPRYIILGGDLSGSASFDGSSNVTISATVTDDSHNHIIANVDGLQDALDGKLSLTGGTLTGRLSSKTCDLASSSATDVLDLSIAQVFRVDASTTARMLSFQNLPGASRAMTVVVHVVGNNAVTWPAGITWDTETAPDLGPNFTRIILFWDGVEWTGVAGIGR